MNYRGEVYGLYMITTTKFMTDGNRLNSPYTGWVNANLVDTAQVRNGGNDFIFIMTEYFNGMNTDDGNHINNVWTWTGTILANSNYIAAASAPVATTDCSSLTFTVTKAANDLVAGPKILEL
jgi:hypothetical protein